MSLNLSRASSKVTRDHQKSPFGALGRTSTVRLCVDGHRDASRPPNHYSLWFDNFNLRNHEKPFNLSQLRGDCR